MSTQTLPAPPRFAEAIGPIATRERIQIVDMLRGFALFGILLVNMALFKAPWQMGQPTATADTSLIDQVAARAIDLFAEGKFFTLFSFLFGFGFSIQLVRAQQRQTPFVPRFLRRLLILLLFGLAHALLIWYGDILVSYALTGMILILFRTRAPKTLLLWSVTLLITLSVILGAGVALIELGQAMPEANTAILHAEAQVLADAQHTSIQDRAIYGRGSYRAILAERSRDYVASLMGMVFMVPTILAMFLLGVYAGTRNILGNVPAHLMLLRRVRAWGILLGLITSLLIVIGQTQLSTFGALLIEPLHFSLSGPLLSMGYAATITLLTQQEHWRTQLAPLAAVGRMALTNYVLQSLICTTIFYGYGLGLFGQVGAAVGIGLTIVIYALQIPFSHWWLQRFQFGPLEWLWRSLTYGHFQPLRRSVAAD